MIRVKVSNSILIEENTLSLLKRYSVFAFVLPALGLIPLETYIPHMHIVFILGKKSSDFPEASDFYGSGFIM